MWGEGGGFGHLTNDPPPDVFSNLFDDFYVSDFDMFCFSKNFGRFASYVGLSEFLRATVGFFESWHHVC